MTTREEQIVACRRCIRLVTWREQVAREKRAAYREESYWGRPVPDFGDHDARRLVVGLAPAAHGANRTGRMFTGDRSGDWLFRALWQVGLASQPTSMHPGDGLWLRGVLITAAVHCAPPQNRPTAEEFAACFPYLKELLLERDWEAILCLGRDAWKAVHRGYGNRPLPRFLHGAIHRQGRCRIIASYHPSQQNTLTGRLTESMLLTVCRSLAGEENEME